MARVRSYASGCATLLITFFLLLTVHEMGHRAVLYAIGGGAKEVVLGAGPEVWRFDFGGEVWKVRLIPSFGYSLPDDSTQLELELAFDSDYEDRQVTSLRLLFFSFGGPIASLLVAWALFIVAARRGRSPLGSAQAGTRYLWNLIREAPHAYEIGGPVRTLFSSPNILEETTPVPFAAQVSLLVCLVTILPLPGLDGWDSLALFISALGLDPAISMWMLEFETINAGAISIVTLVAFIVIDIPWMLGSLKRRIPRFSPSRAE